MNTKAKRRFDWAIDDLSEQQLPRAAPQLSRSKIGARRKDCVEKLKRPQVPIAINDATESDQQVPRANTTPMLNSEKLLSCLKPVARAYPTNGSDRGYALRARDLTLFAMRQFHWPHPIREIPAQPDDT